MSRIPRLLAVALIGVLASSLSAQQKSAKGPAYTEPPSDDPCYPLMGEFVGEIKVGDSQPELLGLQIRPVGSDQFDALSFLGGLPGQDTQKPEPIRMIGRRSDDFVILSGGPWAIFVEHESCLLLDRKGNKVGSLERIQRSSPTLGARPPEGAAVLFDGTNIDQFTNAQMTKDGLLMEGADIKPMFQDFNLHVEFRLPYMPEADGQQRANSGLYLQSRYECQVLDSFGLDPLVNGCGALYRFRAPDVNVCLPPLVWQTYDVQFTAPRWASDGTKIRNAHITSWLNGVKVQDDISLPNKTGAGKEEEPVLLPTKIQNHGDPVRFRNIWVVDRGLASGDFPVVPTPEELAAAAKAQQEQKEKEAAAKQKSEEEKKAAEEEEMKAKEKVEEKKADKPESEKPQEAKKEKAKETDKAKDADKDNAPPKDSPQPPKADKPSDNKPSEAKPSDSEPSDNKPSDSEPSDSEPSDNKPSDNKPSDNKPSDNKPSDSEPKKE